MNEKLKDEYIFVKFTMRAGIPVLFMLKPQDLTQSVPDTQQDIKYLINTTLILNTVSFKASKIEHIAQILLPVTLRFLSLRL